MIVELGRVAELVRYPVKSMAGLTTQSASLGWHGLNGDRRFAFRRVGDDSGFPWVTAGRVPELILYHPIGLDDSADEPAPTHVRTPAGTEFELHGAALRHEIAARCGQDVEAMRLKHGIFDDAAVSVISLATMAGIGRAAGMELDRRRFRANIVLETFDVEPFLEDTWAGGTLLFGDREPMPAVIVTHRDLRCVMINLDPDTAKQDARVMKSAVAPNANNAGVYAATAQCGAIHVGDTVRLLSS